MAVPAMVSAYGFWWLRSPDKLGLPMAVAVIGAMAFALITGAATEYLVFRPLRQSSPVAKLLGSLGVLLTGQAAITLIVGQLR